MDGFSPAPERGFDFSSECSLMHKAIPVLEVAGAPGNRRDTASSAGCTQILCVGEALAVIRTAGSWSHDQRQRLGVHTGGAEANVALHLAAQGIEVSWASRIGADPFGRMVLADLRRGGVDVGCVIVDDERPTGMYVKEVRGPGDALMHYYRAGSAASFLDAADVARFPLGSVGWVHISGITAALSDRALRAVEAMFDECTSTGVKVSFDVNFRQRLWDRGVASARLCDLAERADVVLVGRDEAQDLWGTDSAEQVFDLITQPSIVVVKDGDIGATELNRSREPIVTFAPTPPAEIVEVIGAGDAFAGGYLAGLLRGESSRDRLARGHAAAAWTIGSADDVRPGHVPEPFRI